MFLGEITLATPIESTSPANDSLLTLVIILETFFFWAYKEMIIFSSSRPVKHTIASQLSIPSSSSSNWSEPSPWTIEALGNNSLSSKQRL